MDLHSNVLKILVIEDEEGLRQSFSDFLEDRDFEVLLAENGRIGLELLRSGNPDLVLLDLKMPEVDGLDVLKQGKKINPDIPMIVVSGANQICDVVSALHYGAWDYLEKPVQNLSILGHSIEKALEKARLKWENRVYQEQLEKMVKERTLELEKSNSQLTAINARAVKAFEALQKSEKQYRTLFEETNDAIFIVEKDTGQHLDVNKAAAELTGRSIEELKALNIRNVIPEGTRKILFKMDSVTGIKELGHVVLARPDNCRRIVNINIVPLNKTAIVCIARDITRDLEMETQLRQSHKMEAIGTLAGGIAHDFNNILSGILGYAQLVEMDVNDPVNIKQNIVQLKKGIKRASELVQQILSFSRQVEYEKQPLKIYLIVKEVVKFLRSSIPSTINIVEKINTRNAVLADSTQIHQVVMNLCTNAYQAMQETGGTLSVSLCDIMVNEGAAKNNCQPGLYIKLEVQDTGIGIEEKTMNRIFDPYFTTKKISQGTGLGLAVANGIVKKNNGFITVSSNLGQGTRFNVFFPVIESKTDLKPEIETKEIPFTGFENIMLVEDEEAVLETTRVILDAMGYHVTCFMDGESALKAFETDPQGFDVVITDMIMPKMKGSTLSRNILALRKDIPVILCTGFHETFTKEKALEIGIRRYIRKPVSGKDLALIIREELQPESGMPKNQHDGTFKVPEPSGASGQEDSPIRL